MDNDRGNGLNALRRDLLGIFLIASVMISWILPGLVLMYANFLRYIIFLIPLVPFIIAAILIALDNEGNGILGWLKSLCKWDVPARAYIGAIFIPLTVTVIVYIIYLLVTPPTGIDPLRFLAGILLNEDYLTQPLNLIFMLSSSLGVAAGLYGYAMPRLLKRYSPFTSALILGIAVSLCSTSVMAMIALTLGSYLSNGTAMLLALVIAILLSAIIYVPLSFILVWLWDTSKNSILPVSICLLSCNYFTILTNPNIAMATASRLATFFGDSQALEIIFMFGSIYFIIMAAMIIAHRAFFFKAPSPGMIAGEDRLF